MNIIDKLWESAKFILEDSYKHGNDFRHVAIPLSGNSAGTPLYLAGDKETRNIQLKALHYAIKDMEADGWDKLVIIMDGWMWKIPKGTGLEEGIKLKKEGKLEKREALTMLVCGKDITPRVTVQGYTRSDSAIVWGAKYTSEEVDDRMVPPHWAQQKKSKGKA